MDRSRSEWNKYLIPISIFSEKYVWLVFFAALFKKIEDLGLWLEESARIAEPRGDLKISIKRPEIVLGMKCSRSVHKDSTDYKFCFLLLTNLPIIQPENAHSNHVQCLMEEPEIQMANQI